MALRYPFFDVRVIEFLLAIPRDLCRDKWILRAAMSDRLAADILARPKASYPRDLLRSGSTGAIPTACDHGRSIISPDTSSRNGTGQS